LFHWFEFYYKHFGKGKPCPQKANQQKVEGKAKTKKSEKRTGCKENKTAGGVFQWIMFWNHWWRIKVPSLNTDDAIEPDEALLAQQDEEFDDALPLRS
jgi:hypothetical protein